ncbi:MAG: RibD family protein, partial [Candidatus Eremiobacteraeota bacterium]|nr:RibD family protein [Candidatus Eremiobacteraeota bacterium]
RPYVTLKMAASLDGYVAPMPGSFWLTSPASRERVRELRIAHDAVMIGAGTVRIDNPQLTVRPIHARRRPYARVIVCEDDAIAPTSTVLRIPEPAEAFRRTIIVAPGGLRARFAELEPVAECLFIHSHSAEPRTLDLEAALVALREAGIESVLCEGGPTLASALLACGLVDRLVWFVAPLFLRGEKALPALRGDFPSPPNGWRFEGLERCGDDLMLEASLHARV